MAHTRHFLRKLAIKNSQTNICTLVLPPLFLRPPRHPKGGNAVFDDVRGYLASDIDRKWCKGLGWYHNVSIDSQGDPHGIPVLVFIFITPPVALQPVEKVVQSGQVYDGVYGVEHALPVEGILSYKMRRVRLTRVHSFFDLEEKHCAVFTFNDIIPTEDGSNDKGNVSVIHLM